MIRNRALCILSKSCVQVASESVEQLDWVRVCKNTKCKVSERYPFSWNPNFQIELLWKFQEFEKNYWEIISHIVHCLVTTVIQLTIQIKFNLYVQLFTTNLQIIFSLLDANVLCAARSFDCTYIIKLMLQIQCRNCTRNKAKNRQNKTSKRCTESVPSQNSWIPYRIQSINKEFKLSLSKLRTI